MNITEVKNEGLKREYQLTIPSDEVVSQVQSRLSELAKTIRLDGFRKGKVPPTLLKQRYGKSTFVEVANEMVEAGVNNLLKERGLNPVLHPQVAINKLAEGEDINFNVTVEVNPEIEPQDLKGIKLERLKVAVSPKEVEQELERIASSQTTTEPVSEAREARLGDVVVIDFKGRLESGTVIEGGAGEGFHLELGSGAFIPGFEEQLIGIKLGETKEIKVQFPKEYHEKKLAGAPAIFTVTKTELRQKKPAEINEDFAKKLGFESLDKLKEQVRLSLEKNYGFQSRTVMKRHLLDALAEKHHFPVPEGMVKIEFTNIWDQLQATLARSDRTEVLGEDKDKPEEELKREYEKIAERRVRLGLLLAEIGRRNNITITQEELQNALIAEARLYPGQEKQVFEFYTKNPNALMQLRAPLFEEKVVDYLFSTLDVTEKEVSADALKEKLEEI